MTQKIVGFSLSPQQRQLWLLGDQNAYHSQVAIHVPAPVDEEQLRGAAAAVVSRYEILRTRLVSMPGMKLPVQVIHPESEFAWRRESLVGKELDEILARCRNEPFDSQKVPSRFLLVTSDGDGPAYLALTVPAWCADADSLALIASELADFYNQKPIDSSIGAILQYADVAEWLNERQPAGLTEEVQESDLNLMPFANVPGVGDFSPEINASIRLEGLGADLAERAAIQGVSSESLVLASWGAVLARFLGENELTMYCYSAGLRRDISGTIGPVAGYIPILARYDGALVAQSLARSLEEAKEHKLFLSATHVPFAFEFHDFDSIERLYACTCRFKLKLACFRAGRDLRIELHRDSKAFYIHDFNFILTEFVKTLKTSAGRAAPESVERPLPSGLRLERVPTAPLLVHEVIRNQARSHPERVAVVCQTQVLTYAQLDSESDDVAYALRQAGITNELCVGITMHRTATWPVAILGILKAGAAFVALDPSYPAVWIRQIVDESRIKTLIYEKELPSGTKDIVERCLPISSLKGASLANLGMPSLESLAYVVFTSGSEGAPKGVMVQHSSLSHYIPALQGMVKLNSADRYLHTASFSFSSAIRQLFLPLCAGACVVIADEDARRRPRAFFDIALREQISVVDLIPSFLKALNDELEGLPKHERDALRQNNIRMALSASEPLPAAAVAAWRSWMRRPQRIVNMYGLTETTGIIACHEVAPQGEYGPILPIGISLSHASLHVLNPELRPCCVGETGAIYVSGAALARGYLNQTGGNTLFYTGDSGVIRPDGSLEYRGRITTGCKVRGHRVEPGHVERVIGDHPAVREVIVSVREAPSRSSELVAYIVPHYAQRPTATELRHYLQDKVPDYLIPSAFVLLTELPRVPTGKIDRGAVAGSGLESQTHNRYCRPETDLEAMILRIWRNVLQMECVGVEDDFFDLGGQSLLGVRMLARIRGELGVDLTWTSLTETRTVAALAARIELILNMADDRADSISGRTEGYL